ncbi:MAG: hypothetical protein Q8L85_04275 [Alphaproteobacteria bacterium]|nr:hypothetical protein [Alphaproteobacteria bacterium]
MRKKEKIQEKGGIFIIFLALLPILITLIVFTINNLQASLLYKRLCQAVTLYSTQKQLAYNLIAHNQYGITYSNICEVEDDQSIKGTLTYKPFFGFSDESISIEYSQKIKNKNISIIVLLDLFVDQEHMDHFQKLIPFIDAFKEIAQNKNINFKIIPYAGSINIGKENRDFVTFEPAISKNKRIAGKILDFEKLSPYQAILKNKKNELKLGDQPNVNYWSGCIEVNNPLLSFKEQLSEKFQPYFYASTFGKRYIDDKKNLLRKNHPRFGSLIITGDNNWTNRTIRELPQDYQLYGGFVLGPNIGCPPPMAEDPNLFESSLHPITRGGSMLPLAFDYADFLLKDDKNPKIILIVKSSPILFYDWEGPFFNLITESTGFPGFSGVFSNSDYSAYGRLSDKRFAQTKNEAEEKIIELLKEKMEDFKKNKGDILSFYLDQGNSNISEILNTQSTEHIPFQETYRAQEIIDFIQNFIIRLNFSRK